MVNVTLYNLKIKALFIVLLALLQYITVAQCYQTISSKLFTQQILQFTDSSGRLPFSEIQKKKFQKFEPKSYPKFQIFEYCHHYWLKGCAENTYNFTNHYLLTGGEVYQQTIYYSYDQIKWQKTSLSPQKSLHQGKYPYDYKYLELSLPPYQTLFFYIEIYDLTGQVFKVNPELITFDQESKNRVKSLYDHRWAIGHTFATAIILAFVMLYVLVQFYFVRTRYLALYGIYLLCMLGFHLNGLSYSTYIKLPLGLFSNLQFILRQNFYVLITQLAYIHFLSEFFNVNTQGNVFEQKFFKYTKSVFWLLLAIELFISLILRRYDLQLIHYLFTQAIIIIVSVILFYIIFNSSTLRILTMGKLANAVLFLGVIYGFITATFGWVPTTSSLFYYYPNFGFNAAVVGEVFLYSLAIGQQYFQSIAERGQLQQKVALGQLNTLRSQINPHFIFNSLNSIKSLIIKNKNEKAVDFITDFAVFIRNTLDQSRQQYWSLAQELDLTQNYLNIEKRRFDNLFTYQINVQNKELKQWLVPSFILQPFVENTLKHGFTNTMTDAQLVVNCIEQNETLIIEIIDNGLGLKTTNTTTKGLGNTLISDRLLLLQSLYQWHVSYTTFANSHSGTIVRLEIAKFH